jgi:hypothetical protein
MPIIGGTYRHYKGGLYRVLALARHSETLAQMVVYEALYENQLGQTWVRPAEMFLEEVNVAGVLTPRFQPVPPPSTL